MDIDISPDEGKVYFMDPQNIRRVGLDGTGLETIHSHPNWFGWTFSNRFMAVDSVHQAVYLTYYVFDGEIQQDYTTMGCRTLSRGSRWINRPSSSIGRSPVRGGFSVPRRDRRRGNPSRF